MKFHYLVFSSASNKSNSPAFTFSMKKFMLHVPEDIGLFGLPQF
jgi:hypothetical protein